MALAVCLCTNARHISGNQGHCCSIFTQRRYKPTLLIKIHLTFWNRVLIDLISYYKMPLRCKNRRKYKMSKRSLYKPKPCDLPANPHKQILQYRQSNPNKNSLHLNAITVQLDFFVCKLIKNCSTLLIKC